MQLKTTGILIAAIATAMTVHYSEAAVLQPNKVVVVILQDRASDALTTYADQWDYLNSVAADGLVYSNSHGVTHPSLPNSLALFSGQTFDETGNGSDATYFGPTLATALAGKGFSFAGYAEGMPHDGFQGPDHGTGEYPDLYTRNVNPMALFTELGGSGERLENPDVNKSFASFPTDFSSLPEVSFVIPNNLNNAHGSNEAWPWAGSSDEDDNNILRNNADNWLEANMDAYLQWAKANNSLLIITQDEERWTGGTAETITTVIAGDDALFIAGVNDAYINHYDLLKTILDMYDAGTLGNTATASGLSINSGGQLVPEPSSATLLLGAGLLLVRRRCRRHQVGRFA